MTPKDKLAAVIDRYRSHPEFLGMDIVDVNQPGAVDDRLLHIAASTGAIEDIEVLVSAGASINVPGDLGYTPLHAAAMGAHLSSVRKLLDLGADPLLTNEFGETPAKVAQQLGHIEIARFLEQHIRNARIASRTEERDTN